MHHESPNSLLSSRYVCSWTFRRAPAKKAPRRRGRRPQWAEQLLADAYATVMIDPPVLCPSCGVEFSEMTGGDLEPMNDRFRGVDQCPVCRAPFVVDLRRGTFRPPTEHERAAWRLTFWFTVMNESQSD